MDLALEQILSMFHYGVQVPRWLLDIMLEERLEHGDGQVHRSGFGLVNMQAKNKS